MTDVAVDLVVLGGGSGGYSAATATEVFADNVRDASKFGVGALLTGVDVAGVSAYRQGIIDSKFKGLQGLLKARGITTIDGFGTLTSPEQCSVT
mgnify:CR=1 FL=1